MEKTSWTLQLIWELGSCIEYLKVLGVESTFFYTFFTARLLLPASLPASLPSSLRASLQCCSRPWPRSEAFPLLPGFPQHRINASRMCGVAEAGAGIRTLLLNPGHSSPRAGCWWNAGFSPHEGIIMLHFSETDQFLFAPCCSPLMLSSPLLHSSKQQDLCCLRERTGWLEKEDSSQEQ